MLITVFNICFEGYTLYVSMFIENDDVNVNNSLMHFVIIHFVSKRFKTYRLSLPFSFMETGTAFRSTILFSLSLI